MNTRCRCSYYWPSLVDIPHSYVQSIQLSQRKNDTPGLSQLEHVASDVLVHLKNMKDFFKYIFLIRDFFLDAQPQFYFAHLFKHRNKYLDDLLREKGHVDFSYILDDRIDEVEDGKLDFW